MWRYFLIFYLGITGAWAANPSFQSFNTAHFSTNGLRISLRNPIGGNIYVTNLVVTNLFVENIISDDLLWTNISGVVQPKVGTSVRVTNLTSKASLTSEGSFFVGFTSRTLNVGTNNVNPFQVGSFTLVSPTNDASQVIVRLSGALNPGQWLTLENFGTNGLTVFDDDLLWDLSGGHLRLRGNWVPTTSGETLFLVNNGLDWVEVGRANPSVSGGDNIWMNLGEEAIAPVAFTNLLQVWTNGGIFQGQTARDWFTYALQPAFVSVSDTHLGEDPTRAFYLVSLDDATNTTLLGDFWISVNTNVTKLIATQTTNFTGGDYTMFRVLLSKDNLEEPQIQWKESDGATDWTNFLVLRASGFTGTGDKILSDDGTYVTNMATLQVTNLVVISNIVSPDTLWTNDAGILRPIDLTLQPMIGYGLEVGTNTPTFWGTASSGEALVSVSVVDSGDPNIRSVFVGASSTMTQQDASGIWEMVAYTNRIQSGMTVVSNVTDHVWTWTENVDLGNTNFWIQGSIDNKLVISLHPTAEDSGGTAAHTFGSVNTLSSVPILAVQNNETNQLTFGPLSQITFGPGTTNVLYRSGTDFVLTNGSPSFDLKLINGSGNAGIFSVGAGGSIRAKSVVGQAADFGDIGTNFVRVQNNIFHPFSDLMKFGSTPGYRWGDARFGEHVYVEGYANGSDYARLDVNHTGVGGAIVLSSQAQGTGGSPVPIMFTNQPTVVIAGTTNLVTFGGTNTAPSDGATVFKWISVQVSGESDAYRLPLYK